MYRGGRCDGGLYVLDDQWHVLCNLYLSKPYPVYLSELTGSELTRIPRDRRDFEKKTTSPDFEKKTTSPEVTYSVKTAQMWGRRLNYRSICIIGRLTSWVNGRHCFCVFKGLRVKNLDPKVVLSFLQPCGLMPRHSVELQRDSSLPLFTYLLTYLLTPWCRVLLDKLTGLQLVKKFPAFHGTRRFVTALTNVRQLSLSWASSIQSI